MEVPYKLIKEVAQWASYIGTATTTLVGVYAVRHKPTHDGAKDGEPVRLSTFGRPYILSLLFVGSLTLFSSIAKDIADAKLDADAKAEDRRQLENELGSNFADFAEKKLTPAVDRINSNVGQTTKTLSEGITNAAARLDNTVEDLSGDLRRAELEATQDVSVANTAIDSYDLLLSSPKRREPIYRVNLAPSQVLLTTLFMGQHRGCSEEAPNDDQHVVDCGYSKEDTDAYISFSDFVQELDPSRSRRIRIIVALESFEPVVEIPPLCEILIKDEPSLKPIRPCGLHPGWGNEGLRPIDVNHINIDPAFVSIRNPCGEIELSPCPYIRLSETGNEGQASVKHLRPFTQKYGRNAQLKYVELSMSDSAGLSDQSFPRTLKLDQRLHPTGGGREVLLSYLLRLKTIEPLQDIQVKGLVARYTRF